MAALFRQKISIQSQVKSCLFATMLAMLTLPIPVEAGNPAIEPVRIEQGVSWSKAFQQSGIFLGMQNGMRLAFEDETRRELQGSYFKDYIESVRGLHGWDDGDPFGVNYLGHPWMGSVAGRIFVHNDAVGRSYDFTNDSLYWKSRIKALGWSAAYSAVFELSPVGEAAIGNIGGEPWPDGMTFCDLVITPTLGTAFLIGEDIADRYLIQWIEERTSNIHLRAAARTFINPSRSVANLVRFKWPWHRDTRHRITKK